MEEITFLDFNENVVMFRWKDFIDLLQDMRGGKALRRDIIPCVIEYREKAE